ncbi:hypothetical protein PG993_011590 [Apiospora rasikravindrae]|uniref:DUF7791 domain-containing protein n=1 Tax=Apiospora rasikravindrae TaxID=990691 RepID=A0ABR1S297_9PEZI
MDETGTESASEGDADSPYFKFKVTFIHRTVRDFLVKSPKTLEFLNTNTGGDVDSSIALVKAAVAQLQFAEISVKDNQSSRRILDELFFYTRHAAIHVATQPEAAAALDGLLETAERVWNEILPANVARTIDHIPVSFSGRAAQRGHTSFLKRKFAANLSLRAIEESIDYSLYTDTFSWHSQLESSKNFSNRWISLLIPFLRRTEKRLRRLSIQKPLLVYALTPLRNSDAPNADTVQLLLSQGASPNQACAFRGTRVTIWESFIREFSTYSTTADWRRDESQEKRGLQLSEHC